jgi:hypothetical protein
MALVMPSLQHRANHLLNHLAILKTNNIKDCRMLASSGIVASSTFNLVTFKLTGVVMSDSRLSAPAYDTAAPFAQKST